MEVFGFNVAEFFIFLPPQWLVLFCILFETSFPILDYEAMYLVF